LIDRITDISKTLGVTEDAAKSLLKIVGEDTNIPDDKLAEALSKVAGDYKRLQAQAAALNPENPAARALVDEAKPEIDAGHFERAHELFARGDAGADRRGAGGAQAQGAGTGGRRRADARRGEFDRGRRRRRADRALTERRYLEAAELFGQAADYVPNEHASERGKYLRRQPIPSLD
jgi:hypothetical protein